MKSQIAGSASSSISHSGDRAIDLAKDKSTEQRRRISLRAEASLPPAGVTIAVANDVLTPVLLLLLLVILCAVYVEWCGVEWRGVEWSGVEWSGVEWEWGWGGWYGVVKS